MRRAWLIASLSVAPFAAPAYAQSDDSVRVSFGGMTRQRYEMIRNVDWGRSPLDDDGHLLHRYLLHASVKHGFARLFTEIESEHVSGRLGGPRPTDADALDLHQGFLELSAPGSHSPRVRVGRQEMTFGSERLVSLRDGTNVRMAFDGVRALAQLGQWRTDLFATSPVQVKKGVFDDRRVSGQLFWGAHTTGPVGSGRSLDLYYYGLRRDRARFEQGIAREVRHSIGARPFGSIGAFDYDIELVGQWGRFGAGQIQAWTIASNVGYRAAALTGTPRFGLKADITTGDRDSSDSRLETFNPLFPRGGYFGAASLIGPLNHIDVHPSVDVRVTKRLTVSGDWDFFWRHRLGDGQYAISGLLQVPGTGNAERYVGSQASITGFLKLNRHCDVMANYGHFFGGPFLRHAGLSEGLDYVTIWIDLRFTR
jgi:hypothetical protein